MPRAAYPVVVGYNGINHFFPTMSINLHHYNLFKINTELGSLLAAAAVVLEEVNTKDPTLPREKLVALDSVKKCITANLPVLSQKGVQSYQSQMRQARPGGPLLAQVTGEEVPPSGGEPSLPSSSSAGSSSGSTYPQKEKSKKGRSKYVCHLCGISKQRKNDLEGHLWSVHKIGEAIICTIPPCKGKKFSSKSSLKLHQKTQHCKKWRFVCSICSFGTHAETYLIAHMYKKHGRRAVDKSTRARITYQCRHCKKKFFAPHALQRHKNLNMCMVSKTHQCPAQDCVRKYKTTAGRDRHYRLHHQTPASGKLKCHICAVVVSSKQAMMNHQARHRGMQVLKRAKNQRALAKAAKIRLTKQSSKSTPAKLKYSK